jgi:hypothetical protein
MWLENKQLFGSDDTNSPFKSGIIVLKSDYLISTAFDDTIKSYQLITPWTGSYWSTYIIKGTNIYDSNGTTVLRSSYPVGEWFTMKTTFYSATNKYDVDLIQADGTVISLKSGATYIWPTCGIKKVRYWSGYTSTTPTYRTPFYMDNIENFRVSLSDCDIISCQVPNNATIGTNNITSTTTNRTKSIIIDVTPSINATWRMYSNSDCTTVIPDKVMNLSYGENTAYIKVTAEDGVTTKIYTLTITSPVVFGETFEGYSENASFTTAGQWTVGKSLFTGTILTHSGDEGKSVEISPPTTGGTTTSTLWCQNNPTFGTDNTNSPLLSGTIVLQSDWRIDTVYDSTIKGYQLVMPWTGSNWYTYSIKGSNIYDSNGTTVLMSNYPVGEWFAIRTTFYSSTNKYDLDLIQADDTVVSLKSNADYTWPTGGIKSVRYGVIYTSTTPTYRTATYLDNVFFSK